MILVILEISANPLRKVLNAVLPAGMAPSLLAEGLKEEGLALRKRLKNRSEDPNQVRTKPILSRANKTKR